MLWRWIFTVPSRTNNRVAISLLRRPVATSRTISSSRPVRSRANWREAILPGQPEIEDEDVGAVRSHRPHGVLAVGAARENGELLATEQLLETVERHGMAIGENEPDGLSCGNRVPVGQHERLSISRSVAALVTAMSRSPSISSEGPARARPFSAPRHAKRVETTRRTPASTRIFRLLPTHAPVAGRRAMPRAPGRPSVSRPPDGPRHVAIARSPSNSLPPSETATYHSSQSGEAGPDEQEHRRWWRGRRNAGLAR